MCLLGPAYFFADIEWFSEGFQIRLFCVADEVGLGTKW